MKKKQILKGSSLSVRLPDKTRYGLELAARRNKVQMSALVNRAVDDLLISEGLTKKIDGEVVTWLDKLWSESESERIKALGEHAPMLMTPAEKIELSVLKAIEQGTADIVLRLHSLGLAWDLLAPGISDTFADEALTGSKDFPNTIALKKEVQELCDALYEH